MAYELKIPTQLKKIIEENNTNKKRKINFLLTDNDNFELNLNIKNKKIEILKKENLYYSILPYDLSRKYIEKATYLYIIAPEKIDKYINKHYDNIITYISLSLFQITGIKFNENSYEVLREFEKINENYLFKIQIAGRLMHHDATGPLSASLPFKFIYNYNVSTGVLGYINELLNFYKINVNALGISQFKKLEIAYNDNNMKSSIILYDEPITFKKSMLSNEEIQNIKKFKKEYLAHSKNPDLIKKYFKNIYSTETNNIINVVSDIHATGGKFEFESPNFNILVGDLSESNVIDSKIRGIAVIGNHDLIEYIKNTGAEKNEVLMSLYNVSNKNENHIKLDDYTIFKNCKEDMEFRYKKIKVLNNESYLFNGVRYIGLTIPICYSDNKKENQKIIYDTLKKILNNDKKTPTVIISHAPLFNEVSLLKKTSKNFNKNHKCINKKLKKLILNYNILGFIHGHHHIPSSSGVYEFRKFENKNIFILCSIFSENNIGFDLTKLLNIKNSECVYESN